MNKDLTLLTVEDYLKISEISQKENLSFRDAMEEYIKRNPGKIKNLGTLHEDGTTTRAEITEEGVETKEVDLADELERVWEEMLKERDLLDNDE
jgi:hypothetical protein